MSELVQFLHFKLEKRLYYQESLDVTENIKLFPAELDTLEAIWVEFKLHSQRLLLSVMYRSQNMLTFMKL